MTSSTPSADDVPLELQPPPARPQGQPAGFARSDHAPGPVPLQGPFVSDMPAPGRGVFVNDMPVGRPQIPPKPRIKGVPGATSGADADHRPGGGTWREL